MILANLPLADSVGVLLGVFLTLSIFSYLLGDNVLFRLAIHIFIGVAAGYVAVAAWYNVIWPQLILPLINGSQAERLFVIVPLVLSGLLLLKASGRLSTWGVPAMAYLVGVGAATAIGGAVLGTLIPQVSATVNLFDPQALRFAEGAPAGAGGAPSFWLNAGEAVLFLVGTLATLVYFQFGTRQQAGQAPQRPAAIEATAWVGQVFIAIAFGAIFAGVYAAALAALVERVKFIVDLIMPLTR